MKHLLNILGIALLAQSAAGQLTNSIKQVALDPLTVIRVPVGIDRLSLVQFPGPISDLQGAYIAVDPIPPAKFQITFQPGSHFFSLRALATNVPAALAVSWNREIYTFDLVAAPEPILSLRLLKGRPTHSPTPPKPDAFDPTNRLEQIIDEAMKVSRLQRNPSCYPVVLNLTNWVTLIQGGCEFRTDAIFEFKEDRALVVQVTSRNNSSELFHYFPDQFEVSIGNVVLRAARVNTVDGIVQPHGVKVVFFAAQAQVTDFPAGLLANGCTTIIHYVTKPAPSP